MTATGALALAVSLCAMNLAAELPATRTISLRNIHTEDVVTVEYKHNGKYVPEALERINWVMRDWRRDEQTKMDPALIDLLWEMHRELGSKVPINLISAYRSRKTNNMLRSTVGGQASESRHILGKAADVQFPDVTTKHVRYAALVRERGGVGYYPTSATPFVHVDTDRVRAWPRVPRFELALLFPNGRTQHKPAEGGDISMEDVRTARARQPEVALQLAAFHEIRRKGPSQETVVASLAPGPGLPAALTRAPTPISLAALPQSPRLVAEPRLADRSLRLTQRPTDDDRRKLTQLIALAGLPELVAGPMQAVRPLSPTSPQLPKRKGTDEPTGPDTAAAAGLYPRLVFLTAEGVDALKGWSTGFTPAPAWDEDHPEEAAYRPFPLAPFLTQTASIDDPALTRLVHPDLSRTGETFDIASGAEPMKLRPPNRVAQAMWAETNVAADLGSIEQGTQTGAPRPAAARRVTTQAAN